MTSRLLVTRSLVAVLPDLNKILKLGLSGILKLQNRLVQRLDLNFEL